MNVESEISMIKERNSRVEADKAWEISFERRAVIAIGTYFLTTIFLLMIDAPNPYLASLVPVLGFLLSTLTLPYFREWWLRRRK